MIRAHRGAFEFDWRARLHSSLRDIGESMTWGEALRHTKRLVTDPASALGAEMAGWDYPLTRDAMATMDLFDLTHQVAWLQGGKKGPKPKPYPRPWPDKTKTRPRPTVSQAEVIAALRRAGHTGDLPAWAKQPAG